MLYIDNFYKYIRNIVFPDNTNIKLSRSEQEHLHTNLIKYIKLFPHFPDINLITDLSCENYERKKCNAKLVFLPFENNIDRYPIFFLYDNENICFDNDSRRLIRKILESLDNIHVLVLGYYNNKYYIRGIVSESDVNDLFTDYYFIEISGYLNWSARCKNFNLFDYYKVAFCEFNHRSSDSDKMIDKVLHSFDYSPLESNMVEFKNILHHVVDQNHGTSFVIFNSDDDAKNEANRLCKAGRGFKGKNILPCNKLIECLPQFAKVDGGLILDINLNCYAYGCIYDGYIDESCEGSLARGSRYNSTKLYVNSLNKKNPSTCLGVVFSDDGDLECVK